MKRMLCLAFAALLLLTGCAGSVDNQESATARTPEPTQEVEETVGSIALGEAKVKTFKNSIGTVWVQVIASIENTGNCNVYLSNCKADLESSDGTLLDTITLEPYPQIIAPGETAYYYRETTLDISEPENINADVRPDAYEADVDQILFRVSDVALSEDDYRDIKVVGRVENETADDYSFVYVVVVLRDASGDPVGIIYTILDEDLPAGEKIGWKASEYVLPDDISMDIVESWDVYAYPYQFQF